MSKDICLTCRWCGEKFIVRFKEYARQLRKGRTTFFCSRSCSAKYGNATRGDKRVMVEKVCPHCGQPFETLSGVKSATFCSRSCASAGSVTANRRARAQEIFTENCPTDLEVIARGLRTREGWKYEQLAFMLDQLKERHEFEYVVGNGIFDLALLDKKVLVEFDGDYHMGAQLDRDEEKMVEAEALGWKVVHIPTPAQSVLQPTVLKEVL